MRHLRTSAMILLLPAALAVSACGSSASQSDGYVLKGEMRDYTVAESSDPTFENYAPGLGMVGSEEAQSYLEGLTMETHEEVWKDYFLAIPGGQDPPLDIVIVSESTGSVDSECKGEVSSTYDYAFFCLDDGMVFFPLDTVVGMWGSSASDNKAANTAVAIGSIRAVAHAMWPKLQQQFGLPPIGGKSNELIADCGAGVGAKSFYDGDEKLSDADVADAFNAIRDKMMGGDDPHGTPVEQKKAFKVGYDSGRPGACIEAYWPGIAGE